MTTLRTILLCAVLALCHACSNGSSDARVLESEPIELLDLLPATTRAVFQLYPGMSGALATEQLPASWMLGPLQIADAYGAGMALDSTAQRLVLAQMSDRPDEFVLLIELQSSDVATLVDTLGATDTDRYQGYQRWALEGGRLQLAQLNRMTLAVAPTQTLERSLDTYAGAAPDIGSGPLASYLADLGAEQPNSFVVGLPALYGTVTAPGKGDASLSQARVVSGAFSVIDDSLLGTIAFHTDNAVTYTSRLLEILTDRRAPNITATADIASIDLSGLSAQHDIRPLLKTLVLDMDGVDYTDAVFYPGNVPWLNFKVGENPNSIFINFEFSGQAARDAFTAEHLPAGFTLAPIRILEAEMPRYFLVLNMYQSSGGLVQGARAEWSVFVNDPDTGEPRFLVIEAVADSISADSVNLLTMPEPVTHELGPDAITSYVGSVDSQTQTQRLYFSSHIEWPPERQRLAPFDREFVVANDYIFWGNGVADRGLYNSTVHNREAQVVESMQFSFVDNSDWKPYINASPVHVLVYLNPLEIVISPWWNLGADYLDVSASYRQTLIDFKNNFYPSLAQGNAQAAVRGEGVVLSAAMLSADVPGAQYHFTLHDPEGLLSAVLGPGGAMPAPVALFDSDDTDYYLTLSIYRRDNDACGTKVEWLTYVQGLNGRPESVRLDAFSTQPCLDPEALLTLGAEVNQAVEEGLLKTHIGSPFIQFEATIDLGLTDAAMVGQDWLEAGDRVCSLNNVCDAFFYDGKLLSTPMQRAGAPAAQIQEMRTPWDDYIDPSSVRAGVRLNAAQQASNSWRNLRSFAGEAVPP